jgi:hypothetical protein
MKNTGVKVPQEPGGRRACRHHEKAGIDTWGVIGTNANNFSLSPFFCATHFLPLSLYQNFFKNPITIDI